MRLLLVDPPPPFDVYREAFVAAPSCPSLTMAMLGGAALADGHEVEVLDLRLAADPEATLRARIQRGRPEVIGFSAFSFTFNPTLRLAKLAREIAPKATLALGGVHAQVDPEAVFAAAPFDLVVLAEGEQTLRELLAGRPLGKIAGIVYRDGKTLRRTPARPLLANLDELNFPAYELFDLAQYNGKQGLWTAERIAMIESSRGCPFSCSFCSSGLVFGKHWRAKSPERVVAEIGRALDQGFEEIHFQDDGFTTDLDRAKRICELILTSGRRFRWELYNGIRADRADEEFLRLAARAGCYRIRFGVESGDQGVLDQAGKGLQLSQVRRVFELTRKYGIETIALFMFGLPGETPATMDATARLACELPADFARVSVTIPTPGSALYAQWESEGRLVPASWDDYHFHLSGRLLFDHPGVTAAQIQQAYRDFYRKFYFRPSYVWGRLVTGLRRGTLWRDASYFLTKFVAEPLLRWVGAT
jgi:radical SAM superfamily enzyme YgiQ (UPF0313 family)